MRPFAFVPFRRWMTLAAVCLFVPLGVSAEDPEPPKVSVKIRPLVLFAGGEVKTTVRTPRDPRNRELRVIVEGSDYFASSDVQLDGVDAATSHQFTWKDLPGGPYRVDAILLRENGEKTTVTNCFAVLSGDDGNDSGMGPTPSQSTRRRQQRTPPRPPDSSMGPKTGC
jgi:hypothetical protein